MIANQAVVVGKRLVRATLALGFVMAGLLAASAPASAAVSHALSSAFGAATSSPANPYPLSGPTDVAVDQESRDVYVTDPGNHRVEKFDSGGNLVLMFGKGVNGTTGGDVCVVSSGNLCQAGSSGSAAGQLETPTYLAVDNSGGASNGDIYVGDTGANIVSKFDSEGRLITGWGNHGQKDGSDASDLPVYGPLFGLAVGGNGHLYIGGHHYSGNEWEYTQDGTYIKWYAGFAEEWLKADGSGNGTFYMGANGTVYLVVPDFSCNCQDTNSYQFGTANPLTGFALDPTRPELYQDTGSTIEHYSDCEPVGAGPCDPEDSFGSGDLSGPRGVAVDGATHSVYVANATSGEVTVFGDVRPNVTTEPPTDATESTVTLNGHIDPEGRGDIVSCQFEYGFDQSYGHVLPCEPDPSSANFTGPTDVTATITGLSPGTEDHYRVVAENAAEAKSAGADETFITTQPPAINGLTAENLTATTADLKAQVNPNGLDTHWHFEYGTTVEYGQSAPVTEGTIPAGNSDSEISVHLEGLQPNVVYHYILVATNEDGTAAVEDHTFNFYPPPCPNSNVRQQTGTNYLPDCRAYELVSPGNADGTQLFADGPNTGYASNPPRFAFSGTFGAISSAGGEPIDGTGDLYVATRTATGWVSRYVGMPASEAAVDGGPPLGPPNSTPAPEFRSPSALSSSAGACPACQNGVFTDPQMNLFADFNVGNQSVESIFTNDFQNHTVVSSNAPYVWKANGEAYDRWPTNLGTVPSGTYPDSAGEIYSHGGYREAGEQPLAVSPGGLHALDCPGVAGEGVFSNNLAVNDCPGDVTTSADMRHFVFVSQWNAFAPGGNLEPPGSVYDNDTQTGTIAIVSKTPQGDDIPSEPGDLAGDPLQIPAVSADGSHILIAAGGTGPCGSAECPTPPCGDDYSAVRRCQMQPSHLYVRVNDAITYDVSQGHDVRYVGTNDAGTKVYFTSAEQLTPEDRDASTDLYMWSEAGELSGAPITLVSKAVGGEAAAGEPGNSDDCSSDFAESCGVTTYTQLFYCQQGRAPGGNCLSDNAIAAGNGDIYFFSPEQLDGTRGIANQQNLYVYREGRVQYVTTLKGAATCFSNYSFNQNCTRLERIQVAPDDGHMAFISNTKVTQYDNAGHTEMYTYNPATRRVLCVSCRPNGEQPTSEVEASQDGLFMANDGRTFFSTEDALVHGDTNEASDVYEYTGGRPQLITPGTGETGAPGNVLFSIVNPPGLAGVSADGHDVYFVTYDSFVPEDHNGLFAKFYDARSGGGFPAPAPEPPCEAADECHGQGSSAPPPLSEESAADLAVGNASEHRHRRHGKVKRRCRKAHGHQGPRRSGRGSGRSARHAGSSARHRRCGTRKGKAAGHARAIQRKAGGKR